MRGLSISTRLLFSLVFCLGLSACNLPSSATSTDVVSAQQTSVAQTIAVLETQMAVGSTPVVPLIPTNTPMELVTPTMTPTQTLAAPTPTFTLVPTASPTYRISAVKDITYPDNTVVKPNESFVKTWRLTNGGTGTWTSNFRLVFVSGDAMSGPASTVIGKAVAPGESIDVSVTLKAPATAGKTYQGKWMLQTESGASFGLGTNADAAFWVLIKVDQNFVITSAVVAASPSSYSGACPTNIVFTANITATASGKATYYFVTSLGNSSTYELPFTAAGTVTTGTYTVAVDSSQTVTASVYNDYPNHQQFGTTSVVVDCIVPTDAP